MNLERVDQIAKAVLYEGYMLYPYRPSSVKNRQRWNFGVVYPQAYSEAQGGEEPCSMRTECLVSGNGGTILEVKLRFLHLQTRSMRSPAEVRTGALPDGWQEAVEREVSVPDLTLESLLQKTVRHAFGFPAQTQAHLCVVAQEVVPVEAGAADRWSMIETSMRTVPVVLVDPGRQLDGADLGVVVGTSVGPFAKGGLDEAFGFAIGAGSVGASEAVGESELVAEAAKDAGAITRSIVGKQAANGDAEAGVVIDGSLKKRRSGRGFLVRQDLGEGDARSDRR